MNILPTIRIHRGDTPGTQIFIQLPDLSGYKKTWISADEAAGQTTLSVIDGATFAANEYVVLGQPGTQEAEIRLISSVTATTIVVSSASTYAHPRGTLVTFIPFNQVSIETDDNSGFSSATTLATEDFDIEQAEHSYEYTTGAATDYYRARFYHEQGTRYSSYSDVLIATGFADNTVYQVKRRALRSVGHKIGDFDWLNDSWCNEVLEEGRRDLESQLDRWSFRKYFDSDIGNIVAGQYIISAPSTLREPETAKNLLALYVGRERIPINFIDKKRMNEYYRNTAYTTLNGNVAAAASSVVLTNSRDFDDSGAITIAYTPRTATITGTISSSGTTVTGSSTNFDGEIEVGDYITASSQNRRVTAVASDTSLTVAAAFSSDLSAGTSCTVDKWREDSVNYDDNDRANNTLFGLDTTGSGAIQFGGHSTGAYVWQGISLGLPEYFTVTEDGIIVNQPFGFDYHGRNIYADYWGTFTSINSDADTFDEPDYDMFVSYLAFRIKKRKEKGELKMEDDDDGRRYLERSLKLIARERHEQGLSLAPDISHLGDLE